jgi:hypothetical protein
MFNAERYRRDSYFNADKNAADATVPEKQRITPLQRLHLAVKFFLGCVILLLLIIAGKITITAVEYYAFGSQENVYLLRKISASFSKDSATLEAKPTPVEIGATRFNIPAAYIIFNKPHILQQYRTATIELLWRTGNPVAPRDSLLNLVKWQNDIAWVQVSMMPEGDEFNHQKRVLIDDIETSPQSPLKEGKNFFASKSNSAFDYTVFYKKGEMPTLFKCEKSLTFLKNPTCSAHLVYKDTLLLTYTVARSTLDEAEIITKTLNSFFAKHEETAKPAATIATEQ